MVTIKKISEESGFSQATVSRLLNGDTSLSIGEDTRKKIIKTALRLGYDRSKINTTIEKVAVLFWLTDQEELQDLYFHQLRVSIEKYATLNNLDIIFISAVDDVEALLTSTSGFIGIGSFSCDEISRFKEICPNGVFLEKNPLPDLFDTVSPDTDRMTQNAINLMLKKDYKKIGFIGGKYFDPTSKKEVLDSREVFFRNYLTEKKLLNDNYIYSEGTFTVAQGYSLTLKMINELKDDLPDGIFIASDTIAVGSLQAFNEKSITIPDTLEIISINDNEISKFLSPPLTTFKIDVDELAKTAIDMLVEQLITPRNITKSVQIGAELTIRKSFIPL